MGLGAGRYVVVSSPHPAPRAPSIVKIGGAVAASQVACASLWREVGQVGGPVVVVHGAGPQATDLARRLGHEPRIVAGRRVTTDLDLDVALWTMRGSVNARLVAGAQASGVNAVGISGADGGLVTVERRPPREVDGERVDFGHVGDVTGVDPALPLALLAAGYTPVVATVCADRAGALYNVNADTVAMELAVALGAARLVLVAEAGGVRRDPGDPASLLPRLTPEAIREGVREGWIAGGMRPKLEVATQALAGGVPEVRVTDPGALASGGTVIAPEAAPQP